MVYNLLSKVLLISNNLKYMFLAYLCVFGYFIAFHSGLWGKVNKKIEIKNIYLHIF